MGTAGDVGPAEDAVPHAERPPFDRFVLRKVAETVAELERAYEAYQYSRVTATIVSLTAFLSNVFLDVSKDRLYVAAATGEARRAAQTTGRGTVATVGGGWAPVAPPPAEEARGRLAARRLPTRPAGLRGDARRAERGPRLRTDLGAPAGALSARHRAPAPPPCIVRPRRACTRRAGTFRRRQGRLPFLPRIGHEQV